MSNASVNRCASSWAGNDGRVRTFVAGRLAASHIVKRRAMFAPLRQAQDGLAGSPSTSSGRASGVAAGVGCGDAAGSDDKIILRYEPRGTCVWRQASATSNRPAAVLIDHVGHAGRHRAAHLLAHPLRSDRRGPFGREHDQRPAGRALARGSGAIERDAAAPHAGSERCVWSLHQECAGDFDPTSDR